MSQRPPCQQPSRQPSKEQGIALIMVLLIVAVVSIVATQTSSRIQFEIQKAQNRQQYQQSYWYALGAERLARGLIEAAKNDPTVNLDQAWANPFLSYPIDGGAMSIQISDRQHCFNLNALTTLNTPEVIQSQLPLLQRQLTQLLVELDADPYQIQQLLEPLLDWLDSDTLPTGYQGVEDLHYSALSPAYLPANGRLSDISELKLIQGFRPTETPALEFLEQLRPYLCTLPSDALVININTLPPEQAPLLAALSKAKIRSQDIKEVLLNRPLEGYANIDAFWSQLPVSGTGQPPLDPSLKDNLAVTSEYFLARIQVKYYDSYLILYSYIRATADQPTTYQRRYGGPNE
ncbi:MAG: general secretion pathway protein K [Motiliproteus sp.]|jgi:general secretion pathway protein K